MALNNAPIPATALSAGTVMAHLLAPLGVSIIPVFGALPDAVPDGPAISFRRTALAPAYDKSGAHYDGVTMEVWVYHPDYLGSIALAERARQAIELRHGRLGSLYLNSATLIDASEDYAGDKYIQTLTFNLKITQK